MNNYVGGDDWWWLACRYDAHDLDKPLRRELDFIQSAVLLGR